MTPKLRISVVMPTFNEEQALPLMVEEIRRHTMDFDCEILIVDSSRDDTPKIAEQLGVKVIRQPPQGHGFALWTAITSASGDFIIAADCDKTYPMDRIPEFVRHLSEEGYDIVSGNRLGLRSVRKVMPAANLWANRGFTFMVRLLYGVSTHDVSTGMFGLKRQLAYDIEWGPNVAFPPELIIKSNLFGYRFVEVPIAYSPRVGEVTLNRWRGGMAYLRCIMGLKFSPKASTRRAGVKRTFRSK